MNKIKLVKTPGTVLSIREFVDKNLDGNNLTEREKEMLGRAMLSSRVPVYLQKPRIISSRNPGFSSLSVEPLGKRSAYWTERKIKFKGCNPSESAESFPSESFFFGEKEVHTSRIPFGVLKTFWDMPFSKSITCQQQFLL